MLWRAYIRGVSIGNHIIFKSGLRRQLSEITKSATENWFSQMKDIIIIGVPLYIICCEFIWVQGVNGYSMEPTISNGANVIC